MYWLMAYVGTYILFIYLFFQSISLAVEMFSFVQQQDYYSHNIINLC